MARLSKYEQENLVVELCSNRETMDEDEYEEKYLSLSPKYQRQVDESNLEFADNAVGDASWRSDW